MKSLYRRYRPIELSQVVGQPQVVDPLVGALKTGKVSHAYLFIGPRGCGKTSVARIFAHEVNGFKYEIEDDYVDIIEIDGASNRGIDNIRELREKVAIAPTSGKYKVYIIDEVHMLTKEAFNALLKTLEEPPAHVIFIMATTDAYKVPVTITSRAQTYTFKLADAKTMFNFLKSVCEKEGIKIADEALGLIVKRGGGSFRDSLSLLDQISTLSDDEITKELVVTAMGLPEDEKIGELLNDYVADDAEHITSGLKELLNSGVKAETLVEEMIAMIVDNPTSELIPLLARLAEVKAPFVEAKLLVCLLGDQDPISSKAGLEFSSTSYTGPRAEPSLRDEPVRDVRNIRVENSNQNFMLSQKQGPAQTNHTNFDWAAFVETVRGMNDAIAAQLKSVEYMVNGDTLDIYPTKRVVKMILSKDANKKILVDAANGLKVTVHDLDEKPSQKKDELISKMSDIMGGEVQNDGGGSPF